MTTSRARKPKIFFASSSAAKTVAGKLAERLDDIAEVVLWWKPGAFDPGETIQSALLRHAGSCDFAAVFLPADELAKPEDARDSRDNCIYELGLFTGALGLNPERAFILTSAKQGSLPDDLQGVVYLPIKELTGAEGADEAARAEELLDEAYGKIKLSVEKFGRCYRRPKLKLLQAEDLLQLERPEEAGGSLVFKNNRVGVIVYSNQPVESDPGFAGMVLDNMQGQVDYSYFFEAVESNIKSLPPLIRALAAARLKVDAPKTRDPDYWIEQMEATPQAAESVKRSLRLLQRHLQIYLLAHKAAIQFCIHNADDEDRATCYLRYPPAHFVEWCTGLRANEVVADLRKKGTQPSDDYIFQTAASFDLYDEANRPFRERLSKRVLEQFPESLHPNVKKACFGDRL